MARPTRWRKGELTKPIMTYVRPETRRALEAACERDGLPMAVWLRHLMVAELARLEQNPT